MLLILVLRIVVVLVEQRKNNIFFTCNVPLCYSVTLFIELLKIIYVIPELRMYNIQLDYYGH